MNKKSVLGILFVIGVYILSTGISYALFSQGVGGVSQKMVVAPTVGPGGKLVFDSNQPKTEPCPLNGEKYSAQQKAWWEKHRPLGIMIENHEDARPQSGLSFADVIYEAVAEGGITRCFTEFYCQDAPEVGPVRSARTYFIDFASEYGNSPLYTHVGGANTDGAANALGQLTDYGWTGYNDMNQFSIGFPTFWRDYNRLGHEAATEHTMYSTTTKLWDFANKSRGLSNVDKDGVAWDTKFTPYTFKDDVAVGDRPSSQSIHLEFWGGYKAYFVDWKYDNKTNLYKRNNAGVAHIDRDTNKQLAAKTIVVLYMAESHADDGYENNAHLLYDDKGTGKAIVFMDGKKTAATWRKDSRTSRTLIFTTSGTPVSFDRGLLWFEILPTDGVVNVS